MFRSSVYQKYPIGGVIYFFLIGDFSCEGTLPHSRTYRIRSYTLKQNHIGSVVSEILQYKQTDRRRSFYFILRKKLVVQILGIYTIIILSDTFFIISLIFAYLTMKKTMQIFVQESLLTGQDHDVAWFCQDGTIFRAHKFVLAAFSDNLAVR